MMLAFAERMVLEPAVAGKHIPPAPATIAEGFPFVEILRLAADIDHGVDRARPAEELAARPIIDAAGEPRNRLGQVSPVDARVMEGPAVADRDVHPGPAVRRPGFEEQHPMPCALAEAISEHASRRPRADDDEVVLHARWRRARTLCAKLMMERASRSIQYVKIKFIESLSTEFVGFVRMTAATGGFHGRARRQSRSSRPSSMRWRPRASGCLGRPSFVSSKACSAWLKSPDRARTTCAA